MRQRDFAVINIFFSSDPSVSVHNPGQGIGEAQLLRGLNKLFSDFDREAERCGIDKIKNHW
jgi:hypothetical protein